MHLANSKPVLVIPWLWRDGIGSEQNATQNNHATYCTSRAAGIECDWRLLHMRCYSFINCRWGAIMTLETMRMPARPLKKPASTLKLESWLEASPWSPVAFSLLCLWLLAMYCPLLPLFSKQRQSSNTCSVPLMHTEARTYMYVANWCR